MDEIDCIEVLETNNGEIREYFCFTDLEDQALRHHPIE
jgi:hypothetical protein